MKFLNCLLKKYIIQGIYFIVIVVDNWFLLPIKNVEHFLLNQIICDHQKSHNENSFSFAVKILKSCSIMSFQIKSQDSNIYEPF